MDLTLLLQEMLKLFAMVVVLLLVAHAWLVVTVIRMGESHTRRYLNAAGFKEAGAFGKLMLHFAKPGLRA